MISLQITLMNSRKGLFLISSTVFSFCFREERARYDLEQKELYDEAPEICEKEIPNHPEKTLNLLFAGRNAKRRKADEKPKKALPMLQNLLGDHFMTSLCLKDLAFFYLFTAKTGDELERALNYYKEAMTVLKKLGTHNQKKSVLNLIYQGFFTFSIDFRHVNNP